MGNLRVTLTAVPPRPRAGEVFHLSVWLLDGPATEDLAVTFEKHRIYIDAGGKRELCPIGPDYFADGGTPGPIDIYKGRAGGITAVQVSADARNPPCPNPHDEDAGPILFPDQLIFTAFVRRKAKPPQNDLRAREHAGVTVDAAAPPAAGAKRSARRGSAPRHRPA